MADEHEQAEEPEDFEDAIRALRQERDQLRGTLDELTKDRTQLLCDQAELLRAYDERGSDLEKASALISQLKRSAKTQRPSSAPSGDVVVLDGKTWEIRRTVMAKHASDEVKKGHIEEDCTLVVIDRRE